MPQALSKYRLVGSVYSGALGRGEKSHCRHTCLPSQITNTRPVFIAIFGYLY